LDRCGDRGECAMTIITKRLVFFSNRSGRDGTANRTGEP
jgi:hypothetical protein